MMMGQVNDFFEMAITIAVRGSTGIEKQIDLLIDTGFSATLTLPSHLIQELQLDKGMSGRAMLADGTISHYQNYLAEIFWNDQWRTVEVLGIGEEALLGTGLLEGHELQASFINAGQVKITPIA